MPQAWFWHFYTVGLVVNTAGLAVLTAGLLFANGATAMPRAIVILAALQTHLFRRWAESLFLMRCAVGLATTLPVFTETYNCAQGSEELSVAWGPASVRVFLC